MSDFRWASGSRTAVAAGLTSAIVTQLIVATPAYAATITKDQTWVDGSPEPAIPQTIQENGALYTLINASQPVRNETQGQPQTFPATTRSETRVGTPNNAGVLNGIQPPQISESYAGKTAYHPYLRYEIEFRPGTWSLAYGATYDTARQASEAAAAELQTMKQNYGHEHIQQNGVREYSYSAGGESINRYHNEFNVCQSGDWVITFFYGPVTIPGSGTATWARTLTYQSIDNATTEDQRRQQEQLALARQQEEQARINAEQEQRRQEQLRLEQEEQAKTLEGAKTVANQSITDCETLLAANEATVSPDLKTQAQQWIDTLRLAVGGDDLNAINDARTQLQVVMDQINAAVAAAAAQQPTTPADDPTTTGSNPVDEDEQKKKEEEAKKKKEQEEAQKKKEEEEARKKKEEEEAAKKRTTFLAIGGGLVAVLVAGTIVGLVVAKKRKKKGEETPETPAGIDPSAAAAAAAVGTGVAGAGVASAIAEDGTVVAPELIPGYVPITDTTSQLIAFINDGAEYRELLEWDATISPSDDIPTIAEIPINEQGFVPIWLDEAGDPVFVTDEMGNMVPATDEAGNVVFMTDEEGNPQLDEAGNPQPMPQYIIPDYMLMLSEDDVAKAVSDQLLIYSSDGQEIFRGPLASQTILDTNRLYEVLNGQAPEGVGAIAEEVTAYINAVNSIQTNNEEAVRQYKEQQELLAQQALAEQQAMMGQQDMSQMPADMSGFQDMSQMPTDMSGMQDMSQGFDPSAMRMGYDESQMSQMSQMTEGEDGFTDFSDFTGADDMTEDGFQTGEDGFTDFAGTDDMAEDGFTDFADFTDAASAAEAIAMPMSDGDYAFPGEGVMDDSQFDTFSTGEIEMGEVADEQQDSFMMMDDFQPVSEDEQTDFSEFQDFADSVEAEFGSLSQDESQQDDFGQGGFGQDDFGQDDFGQDDFGQDDFGQDDFSQDGLASDGFQQDNFIQQDGFAQGDFEPVATTLPDGLVPAAPVASVDADDFFSGDGSFDNGDDDDDDFEGFDDFVADEDGISDVVADAIDDSKGESAAAEPPRIVIPTRRSKHS